MKRVWTTLKWTAARTVLRTVGRAYRGIRIGYRFGFDSGVMLDHVYENRARGVLGVGLLIDRVFLDAVGWRAIRARRELLSRVLREEIGRREGEVFVLDVAAGPGRYLQDLLEQTPPGRLRVLCRDLAPAGLRKGEAMAAERGLTGITYEVGDALAPVAPEGRAPDVIVVSGLYELLLDDAEVRESIERLRGLLAADGVLVFTTQTRHPQLELIAGVLTNRDGEPWVMKCRDMGQAEDWAALAGFKEVSSRRERVGLFTVTLCRA
ncbi:class I SAM-dependent methyltransferase family protein [Streptomyces albus]|nr:class I SAM-dependent methyltransferase family protein [Streptomyces albus]